MAEVKIFINGRAYDISCDAGQEGRVVDLATYVDQKLQAISRSGSAYNDAHLMVLTALVVADELFDARDAAEATPKAVRSQVKNDTQVVNKEEEIAVMRLLEQMAKRIDGLATRVQSV